MKNNDITGKKFGLLTVVGRDYSFHHPKRTKWICECKCGNIKSIYRDALIQGRTKSCGCQMHCGTKGINSTHGLSNTRLFKEWLSMKRRCKPNTTNSKNYFDRNIRVCDEWQSDFLSFYNWAINNGYNDSLTIDRINNDEGYYPENCRWITIEQQQSNKTNTIKINYQGTEYCLRTLCSILNFPYKTAYKRYTRLKQKNLPITSKKIFEPICENKIAFKYRKQD